MPAPEKEDSNFTYLSPDQQKKLKEIQEAADPNFGMASTTRSKPWQNTFHYHQLKKTTKAVYLHL